MLLLWQEYSMGKIVGGKGVNDTFYAASSMLGGAIGRISAPFGAKKEVKKH